LILFLFLFKVLSEFPQSSTMINPNNNYNYLPGYAAFVHAFIAGFCGIRPRDFQLDIVYPTDQFTKYQSGASTSSSQFNVFKQPLANVDAWNITGLTYRGNKLDIIYNFKSKNIEIRNRRSSDSSLLADDSLEISVYEGTERVIKQLKVGDSVMISLTTELWTYEKKKSRLQTDNSFADNMHILASIYPTQFSKYLVLPKNNSNFLSSSLILFLFFWLASLSLFGYNIF
jgi:hypothetical protein